MDEGERALEDVRFRREERGAIEGREEPLVRVHDERVGVFDAGEDVAHLRHDGGNATVRTVDVQPDPFTPADLGDRGNRIDARDARRANGGDAREREAAAGVVVGDRGGERGGPHAEVGVDIDMDDVVEPQA